MKRSILALIVAVSLSSVPGIAQTSRGSTASSPTVTKNVQVIVRYRTTPTMSQHLKAIAAGGVMKADLSMINSGAYAIPASSLSKIEADPDVLSVDEDHPVHSLLDNTAAAINAGAAWWSFGLDGSGIGVAVIDSGISSVDDLQARSGGQSRVVYSENFIQAKSAIDYYGHGQHVSGIIAGNGADSTCRDCERTFRGIAPGAHLIDLRVLDSNGDSAESFVIAAIQRAIQLKDAYNIRVINISLGHPVIESYKTDPLCQAVELAWQAGIVVVVAAGNDGRDNSFGNNGYGTIFVPGNDPAVITVGAMKSMGTPQRGDDRIASYSSKGPTIIDHVVKPDIVAPGNQVVSLLAPSGTLQRSYPENLVPLKYYECTSSRAVSRSYFTLSGTSMAAPAVSGAAALLLQAHPELTPDQVKARLMLTAYKTFPKSSVAVEPTTGQSFTSYYDAFTVGAGYLDIQAALLDNHRFTGAANSPVVSYKPGSSSRQSNGLTLVCGADTVCASNANVGGASQSIWDLQSSWATQSTWSAQAVWSTQATWATQSTWSTQASWSTQSSWSTQANWSTQAVWSAQATWATQVVWSQATSKASALIQILGEN